VRAIRESRERRISISESGKFKLKIRRTITDRGSHVFETDDHVHRELEIYINLTGDISFLVNNELYSLSSGDLIIARPGEYHHCIYRSDALHSFYWILLECDEDNPMVEYFFSENKKVNFVSPPSAVKDEIKAICQELLEKEEGFFETVRLFQLIKQSVGSSNAPRQNLPDDLNGILDYLYQNISERISIKSIAEHFFLSQSTVERRFKEYFDTKPMEFIQKAKLNYAASLLRKGESVLNAGLGAGYQDNSYFITLFTRHYKMTPKEYKKKSKV